MGSVIAQLIPFVLGAALAPAWIIIVLLLLTGQRGLLKGSAFVLGMTLTRLVQGVLFGFVFGASSDAAGEDGGSPVASTLLLVLGILLLITAYRKWRKESDPDEAPPQWMQSLANTTPLKALGMGALLTAIGAKLWVFTLSAIAVIREAELDQTTSIIAFVIYIFLAQLLLIVPLIISAVAPKASQDVLARANRWLATYNRPITVTVTLIFGVYFTYSGISGLLS
jgi:hypothetical protein